MRYKHERLGIRESGTFRTRTGLVQRPQILPPEHADQNLLPFARSLEKQYRNKHRIKRHRFFHHLNSSQAFAFNLFLPFFAERARAVHLLGALGDSGRLESFSLEAIPNRDEGTNLDAEWNTPRGRWICEVKLSEREFGVAVADKRRCMKLDQIYAPTLREHVDNDVLTAPGFFAAYQVWRNIWHLVRKDGATLIFLLPRANEVLWNSLPRVLDRVRAETRSRIKQIAIEDVVTTLAESVRNDADLRAHMGELRAKYVLPEVRAEDTLA